MDTTDNNLGIEFAPRMFSEYVGNSHVVNAIMAKVASGSLGNAILLSGYTGVGKTTLAMLIERVVNCQNPIHQHNEQTGGDVIEPCGQCASCQRAVTAYSAVTYNKVEDMRTELRTTRLVPEFNRNVLIIDEVQALTPQAAALLLSALEDANNGTLFILTTNEPEKILATVRGRCQSYHLQEPDLATMRELIRRACVEYYRYDEQAALEWIDNNHIAETCVQYAGMSLRGALNVLSVLVAGGTPTSAVPDDAYQHCASIIYAYLNNDHAALVRAASAARSALQVNQQTLHDALPILRAQVHALLMSVYGIGGFIPKQVEVSVAEVAPCLTSDVGLLALSVALNRLEDAMLTAKYEPTAQLNRFYSCLLA